MIEVARDKSTPSTLRLLNLGRRDTGENLKEILPRPVFILSTGRTGTQFLANYFALDPQVYAVHEPSPSLGLRFWTVAYLEEGVDRSMMTATLRRYRTGFFKNISHPIYIESNNFLAGFAESLIEVFDDPLLIHIVRDPRTYVRSAINNGATVGLKGLANRLVPYAHLDLERTSEHPEIDRSARYWTLLNKYLHDVGQEYAFYFWFRFEDLFVDNSVHFRRLVDVVGAGDDMDSIEWSRKVNKSPKDLMPRWDEWSEGQKRVVIETCGDTMAHFGYVR